MRCWGRLAAMQGAEHQLVVHCVSVASTSVRMREGNDSQTRPLPLTLLLRAAADTAAAACLQTRPNLHHVIPEAPLHPAYLQDAGDGPQADLVANALAEVGAMQEQQQQLAQGEHSGLSACVISQGSTALPTLHHHPAAIALPTLYHHPAAIALPACLPACAAVC